jgi:hypothetical protein
MNRKLRQDPFIFRLVTLLATDSPQDTEISPLRTKRVMYLMAAAGVAALLFGVFSSVIPW